MSIKAIFLLLLFSLYFSAPPSPVMEWLTDVDHDFGDILQGTPVTVDFKFTNLTDSPLTIDNVRTTCGCTASEWSEVPTPPDSTGMVRIVYDARKPGHFYKKIRVFFTGQRKVEMLTIFGFVE